MSGDYNSSSIWRNYRGNLLHTGESRNNGPVKSFVGYLYDIENVQIISSPAVDMQGNVYFGTDYNNINNGNIYKISSTGSFIWKFYGNSSFPSSPALSYDEKVLYCGGYNSYMYAISTLSGSLVWHVSLNYSLTSSPYVYGKGIESVIFVGAEALLYFALNATNGEIITYGSYMDSIDFSSPVFYNNTLYCGCLDFQVHAHYYVDSTFSPKWTFMSGGQIRYALYTK